MEWWWISWRWGRAGGKHGAFVSTVPTLPDDPASGDTGFRSRLEVCPPSLFDDDFAPTRSPISLLPPLTSIRKWLQTGWYSTSQQAAVGDPPHRLAPPPIDSRLNDARQAFVDSLIDLDVAAAQDLTRRARAAHSLRELWHLRNPLFTLISISHCESIARERMSKLNGFFPIREPGSLERRGTVGRTMQAAPRQ